MSFNVWEMCEEITNKQNWYSKVFDERIVEKWRNEVPTHSQDIFNYALKLLQASAQGSKHLKDCKWENITMCEFCYNALKQQIINNPEVFSLSYAEIAEPGFFDEGWEQDYIDDDTTCQHVKCNCISPDSELYNYVQYHPEGVVDKNLHNHCKDVIAKIASEEPIDWHPGSSEQVRDIIHPSLNCYVQGKSIHIDGNVKNECEEELRYQWLPSEFEIKEDMVSLQSYINNIDVEKYPEFVPLVEKLVQCFVPSLETVLKQKFEKLQIIVKVGDIILTKNNPKYLGGSWHIEGMPYEHIAATCIHYVNVDNITDSFLEFRKPTIINEDIDYPQCDETYTSHHYGLTDHYDGVMNRYLGLIKCHEGALVPSVVFPNTLQHHVKDFSLLDHNKDSTRTIIAFFIIDPKRPIISTKDIPKQQFTKEEANYFRERLMYHRKYFVSQMNEEVFERPFSLCEH